MARIVKDLHQDLPCNNAAPRAWRGMCALGLWLALSAVSASTWALSPGAYRCVSFNVGGAGGRCTSPVHIELRADGSYTESSTTGRYTVRDGQVVFSESRIRGPGQLIDDTAFRFQYTYKGLVHTATYQCFDCSGAAAPVPAKRANGAAPARVGVTLHIDFSEQVAGATGFVIVPRALAAQFGHRAALPPGAVSGLVVDVSRSQVQLATNRYNRLAVGQPYVVFLVYPAETVAVAAFDLPVVASDYEGKLRGGIYRNGLPVSSRLAAPPQGSPDPGPGESVPLGSSSGALPPFLEMPSENSEAPAAAQGDSTQELAAPGTPATPAPALEGFANALQRIGDLFNALGSPGQSPPGAGSVPKCKPNIPTYSQAGCEE